MPCNHLSSYQTGVAKLVLLLASILAHVRGIVVTNYRQLEFLAVLFVLFLLHFSTHLMVFKCVHLYQYKAVLSKRSVYCWASPLPVLIPSKNDLVPTAASPRIESEANVETKSDYRQVC